MALPAWSRSRIAVLLALVLLGLVVATIVIGEPGAAVLCDCAEGRGDACVPGVEATEGFARVLAVSGHEVQLHCALTPVLITGWGPPLPSVEPGDIVSVRAIWTPPTAEVRGILLHPWRRAKTGLGLIGLLIWLVGVGRFAWERRRG
jgi:hypothetical protein